MQLWKHTANTVKVSAVCVFLHVLVLWRPPVLPAAPVETEALSQGCSSALLFRDNDKALNPSVDLTFVPPSSIFKLFYAFESCDPAGAGRIRCMFGQRWLQKPPFCLVWQTPATTTQLPAKKPPLLDLPDTQNHYVVFVMEGVRGGVGGGESEEKRKWKRKRKREVYFCLRKTLRVWSSVTQTCYRRPFKRERLVDIRLPPFFFKTVISRPIDWEHVDAASCI